MNAAVLHYYRSERAHQMAVYPSCVTTYQNGKTELTAASSPYGEHALCAYRSAKRSVAFAALRREKNHERG